MRAQDAAALVLGFLASTATCTPVPLENAPGPRPTAVIYRGPAASPGCPESVAHVLKNSPMRFEVWYAGPNEDHDISDETLAHAAVYVQPGGGTQEPAWNHVKQHTQAIRKYVANGGRYLGFCLGAYLADHGEGFGLLPQHQIAGGASEECCHAGSPVQSAAKNTVIQVDWDFATGNKSGTVEDGRWLFFQDGAQMHLPQWDNITIKARYTQTQDVASAIVPFEGGWVGVVGPHPEAGKDWYTYGFQNPDGIHFDIATDFAMATMHAGTE